MKKESLEENLKKEKVIAMLAPSFIVEFSYPSIINQLKKLGFKKVVELTFGAKMINREYHKLLCNSNKLVISSTCPGIAATIKIQSPKHMKNIAKIDSPMIAMAKICKKFFKDYKTCFISPCNFKKHEAQSSKYVDYVVDYQELKLLFKKYKIKENNKKADFDSFYNEYTRIYPLSGGLSKTAHFKGALCKGEEKVIDGIQDVLKFLKNPEKKIRFLDCTFCKGGCIGGPFITEKDLAKKRKKLMKYISLSKSISIPKQKKGIIQRAEGIRFTN